MTGDFERRLTALEVEHKHMSNAIDKMSSKVDEMHQLLTQARGARWAILAVVAISSFFAGKLGAISGFFNVK